MEAIQSLETVGYFVAHFRSQKVIGSALLIGLFSILPITQRFQSAYGIQATVLNLTQNREAR